MALSGQGDKVALQAPRLVRLLHELIDLVQIAANAQQQSARADRCQVIGTQAAVRVVQVLHAIRLAQVYPAIERVEINLNRG